MKLSLVFCVCPDMNMKLKRILKWSLTIVLGISIIFTTCLYIFKDQIVALVLEDINAQLKRPIQTKGIELTFWSTFPNLEVDMKEVYLQSAFSGSQASDTLLFTEHLYLKFSPFDLMDGNYEVKTIHFSPGKLNLKVNKKGDANYDILNESENEGEDFLLKLKGISFENFTVKYSNELTQQNIETNLKKVDLSGQFSDKEFVLATSGDLNLTKLQSGEVTLLANKDISYDVNIQVNNDKESYTLAPSVIAVENLPFKVEAKADQDSLNFKVQSENIALTDLIHEFLSDKERDIKKLQGDGQINFVLTGCGGTKKDDKTKIQCSFGVKEGTLIEPFKQTKLEHITIDGFYSNTGEEKNELLAIREFQCTSASGPFSGDLKITRFSNPKIKGKAKGKIDLGIIFSILQPEGIDALEGQMELNSSFDVQNETKKDETTVSSLNAQMKVKNATVKLTSEQYPFKSINADIRMSGDQLFIDYANMAYGSSDLRINGSITDVIDYMSAKQKIKPTLSIQSDFLNLDEYFAEENKVAQGKPTFILPNEINGSISINASKLVFEQHIFNQLNTSINFKDRELQIPHFVAQNSGALWKGKMVVREESPLKFQMTGSVNSPQVDLKTLFGEWHNLYQDNLTSEHILSGKGIIDMDFNLPYDALKEEVDLEKMEATLRFSLDNGRFRNIPLFKEMTTSLKSNSSKLLLGKNNIEYLDKKLGDITIPHIENTISVSNGNIIIPKMSINSSAMNIELTGVHGLNDIVDYRLELNVRDLMDISRQSEFGEITYEENGAKLFLHITGHLDNLNFTWDKSAHKEQLKQNLKEEQQEIKSLLKTEFGLFKKDSTVKKYEPEQKSKEEIKINFGQKAKVEDKKSEEPAKEKKEGVLKKSLKNWKSQEEEEKKPVTTFKVGG